MVAHRLVEIQRVENRSVEASQEFLRHDEDLWLLVRLREVFPDRTLALFVDMPSLEVRLVIAVRREHDCRVLGRQALVEGFLVEDARLAINSNEERLVAERLDVLAIMVRDIRRYLLDSLSPFEEVLEIDRPVEDL